MARLTAEEFLDEAIYRRIQFIRYITGQVNYVQFVIKELNQDIAQYVLKKELIETKGQYHDSQKYIRQKCMIYRERLNKYLQKELKAFVKEQSAWIYQYSPSKLEKVDRDKILRDINFVSFSDTDNIKSYIVRIFNQIFQLWSNQLRIAYRVKLPMSDMVKQILE